MDAKAKVVQRWAVAYAVGNSEGEFVTLTDHEAALAELEFANTVKQVDDKYIGELEDRLSTLLTGLEALAGEWKRKRTFEGSVADDAYSDAADALCTLTNSAKAST